MQLLVQIILIAMRLLVQIILIAMQLLVQIIPCIAILSHAITSTNHPS